MSRSYRRNFLVHMFRIQQWMRSSGASGSIDPQTLALSIRCNGKALEFFAQAMGSGPNGLYYSRELSMNTDGFVGWNLEGARTWETAKNKLEFKAQAESLGLPTPTRWNDLSQVHQPFLIKASISSFGKGLRGPFTVEEGRSGEVHLLEGEYAEAFEWGRIGRCWYWGAELCAIELVNMPFVVGDGVNSIETLAKRRLSPKASLPTDIAQILKIQGFMLHDTAAIGKRVLVDYRYLSVLMDDDGQDSNLLGRPEDHAIESTMKGLGQTLTFLLPPELRQERLFVIDMIVTSDLTPKVLEINSNPLVHPAAYRVMLNDLFGVSTDR